MVDIRRMALAAGMLAAFGVVIGLGRPAPAYAGYASGGVRAPLSCPPALGGRPLTRSTRGSKDGDTLVTLGCVYGGPNHLASEVWVVDIFLATPASPAGDDTQYLKYSCGGVPADPTQYVVSANHLAYIWFVTTTPSSRFVRDAAAFLVSQVAAHAKSCPPSSSVPARSSRSHVSKAATAPASAGTAARSSGSGGFDPIAGLAAGAVAVAALAGTALGVNVMRKRSTGTTASTRTSDVPNAIYDGPPAIGMLVNQGWLTPVARPDGTVGYRPTGDLRQYLAYDHGGWQPGFAAGTTGPDGSNVGELAGVAYTPSTDGLIDSITIVATNPPLPPPPAAPAPSMPSLLAPAATTTPTRTDLGSQMALDPTGEFLDFETGHYDPITIPLLLRPYVESHPAPAPPLPAPVPAPPTPPVAATAPSAPVVAPSPFAALLTPSGGSLSISAADLPRVAPTWIGPDSTITSSSFAGIRPTVTFGDGTISVLVAPYRATAQLSSRDGRIVVSEPTLNGPGADFVDTNDIRTRTQAYLDQTLNGPAAGHGLHITNVTVTHDGIRISTGPVTP
jgi:hypothetical protein